MATTEDLVEKMEEMRQTIEDYKGAAQPTFPASVASAIQLKPFSGELHDPTATIGEFRNQFLAIAEALQWTEKQQIAMLPLFLKGHAKETYNGLSDRQKKNSIADLFENLSVQLHSPDVEKYTAIHLRSRKQSNVESVANYAADIKRLIRIAYSSQPRSAQETLAQEAFINGLKRSLKEEVLRWGPENLD